MLAFWSILLDPDQLVKENPNFLLVDIVVQFNPKTSFFHMLSRRTHTKTSFFDMLSKGVYIDTKTEYNYRNTHINYFSRN